MDRRQFLTTGGLAGSAAAFSIAAPGHALEARPGQSQAARQPDIILRTRCAWDHGRAARFDDIASVFAATLEGASGGRIVLSLVGDDGANGSAPDILLGVPNADRPQTEAIGRLLGGLPVTRPVDDTAYLNWLVGAGGLMLADRIALERGLRLLAIGQLSSSHAALMAGADQPGATWATALQNGIGAAGLVAEIIAKSELPVRRLAFGGVAHQLVERHTPMMLVGMAPQDVSRLDANAVMAAAGLPIHVTGATMTAMINADLWDRLPADVQALIETSAMSALIRDVTTSGAFGATVWPAVADSRLRSQSDGAWFATRLDEAARDVVADTAKRDADFAALLASFEAVCFQNDGVALS